MTNYIYNGETNLTFSHRDKDFMVHGPGPHNLPEDSDIVQSNVQRGTLVSRDPVPEQVSPAKEKAPKTEGGENTNNTKN